MSQANEASQLSSYASILVPVDLGTGAEHRVKFAGTLADTFSSRLTGVAAEEITLPISGDGAYLIDAKLVEIEEQRVTEDLAEAETVFRRAAGTRNRIEWRCAIRPPAAFISEQARAADVIVVGRQGPDDPSQGRLGIDPGDLLMQVGRPILTVPPRTERLAAERIVVAWKDTREARRAVWDGLPLLKRAEEVFVVAVGRDATREGAADVNAHLVRHGVPSRAVARPDEDAAVADVLLRMAEEEGAGLIVCGAYGHSRVREWIFGGVTRDLLRGAPVPCLLSH
jgi:nucleotide-binding universal stress UspA family protein